MTEHTPVTEAQKQADIRAWTLRQKEFIREEGRKYDQTVKQIAGRLAETAFGGALAGLTPSDQTVCWLAARVQYAESLGIRARTVEY